MSDFVPNFKSQPTYYGKGFVQDKVYLKDCFGPLSRALMDFSFAYHLYKLMTHFFMTNKRGEEQHTPDCLFYG